MPETLMPTPPLNLLVIEDDASLRELLKVHLEGLGYAIQTAGDAGEAIRLVLARPPDLILTDINIPYMNGLELLEALKGDALTRKVPVVILSGRNDDESWIRATRLGAAGYVNKPVRLDELVATLQRALPRAA